jgi:tRNA G18 (ribose-2'-O)-methylase SpoU
VENQDHKQKTFEDLKSIKSKPPPIILICEEVNDSNNIGSIIRLADAANIEKVIFVSEHSPNSFRKIDKVARSTRQIVKPIFCSFNNLLDQVPIQYEWVAIEITNKSLSYKNYNPSGPVALILGSEVYGLSDQILQRCKTAIHIPMFGQNTSMNVAMAGAIIVYDLIDKF